MKKQSTAAKPKKQVDWDAVAERTRQQCNKLTEEKRKELLEAGLRITTLTKSSSVRLDALLVRQGGAGKCIRSPRMRSRR